jgi:hypothetical protein
MSCNNTLHDIVHALVTNLICAFPSQGLTVVTLPLHFIEGNDVLHDVLV